LAASILLNEYVHVLKNPHYVPVCNLNPVFSCSTVTGSDQAHAFGIPNELIGLAGYGAVAAIGVGLLAGAKFKKWFWQLVQIGLTFMIAFITWLQFQTLYRIGALCLFCMVLWAVSIPLFWYTTLYNFREGNIKAPKSLTRTVNFAQQHHLDILVIWFLLIIVLILKRFWYYYGNF